MNRSFVFRTIVFLVMIGVLVGLGYLAYNAGLAQGAAQAARLEPGQAPVYPYYGWHMPFFGFWPFGLLGGLLLIFIFFGLLRALFWRGRGHWGHMHGEWKQGEGAPGAQGVPPFFAEWHRRAHEQPQPPQPPAGEK